MSIFAIGDLHLAFGTPEKSMEVFGGRWQDYMDKIAKGFSLLSKEDICVICGDFCWAMDLESARPDFAFLHELPGKKYMVKGNHDYWWTTASKMNRFFEENGFNSISLLHNNAVLLDELALCGTRGWFFEEESGTEHDEKILRRELGRLDTSLSCGGEREKIVFLHYPPLYYQFICQPMLDKLSEYGVRECYYGHIHGSGIRSALQGEREGTCFRLISADYLDFVPLKVR